MCQNKLFSLSFIVIVIIHVCIPMQYTCVHYTCEQYTCMHSIRFYGAVCSLRHVNNEYLSIGCLYRVQASY